MKITNLEFNESESAALYAKAGAALKEQGVSKKNALALIETLTPQNIVRLALGFKQRQRGGARPNTGNRKQKGE